MSLAVWAELIRRKAAGYGDGGCSGMGATVDGGTEEENGDGGGDRAGAGAPAALLAYAGSAPDGRGNSAPRTRRVRNAFCSSSLLVSNVEC